jgi:hypothetical protein
MYLVPATNLGSEYCITGIPVYFYEHFISYFVAQLSLSTLNKASTTA